MALFGRKQKSSNRCPDCRFYAMVESTGYCTKNIPATINARLLSQAGIKRQSERCPAEMTCESWEPR